MRGLCMLAFCVIATSVAAQDADYSALQQIEDSVYTRVSREVVDLAQDHMARFD